MRDTSRTTGSISKIGRISAASAAATALRDAILNGDLLMGQALSEAALCDLLGVSRTPLREALVQLEGQQLIEVAPYKGTRVFSLSVDQITDLGAFRKMLETEALKEAMDNDPKALASELEGIVEDMSAVRTGGEADGFGKLDTRFHECIIAHSRNQYLIHAYKVVAMKIAVLRMMVQRDDDMIQRSHEGHAEMLRHIREGHRDVALALLERHIDNGTRFYAEETEDAIRLRVAG